MFILLLIIVGVILWYFGILNRRGDGGFFQSMQHRIEALDVAKQRYARGEINKEEYDTLRKDLAD